MSHSRINPVDEILTALTSFPHLKIAFESQQIEF
jgi:hypothetical protein